MTFEQYAQIGMNLCQLLNELQYTPKACILFSVKEHPNGDDVIVSRGTLENLFAESYSHPIYPNPHWLELNRTLFLLARGDCLR